MRLDYATVLPAAPRALHGVEQVVGASSLEPTLLELVKVRASQINGCAFCVDMHTKARPRFGHRATAPWSSRSSSQRPFARYGAQAPIERLMRVEALLEIEIVVRVPPTGGPADLINALQRLQRRGGIRDQEPGQGIRDHLRQRPPPEGHDRRPCRLGLRCHQAEGLLPVNRAQHCSRIPHHAPEGRLLQWWVKPNPRIFGEVPFERGRIFDVIRRPHHVDVVAACDGDFNGGPGSLLGAEAPRTGVAAPARG
jgi:AhpD family alkylhydroperoxidase